MKDYITISNDYFEMIIPSSLKKYGEEVLNYSTSKIIEFLSFFKKQGYEKIKCAFLLDYNDFITRIKQVSTPNTPLPPKWATGCFYGGEIQILLDRNNPYLRFNTLAHESFHLLFSKFIYEKKYINRIIWLDESLAINFDGTTEKLIESNTFKKNIIKLLNNQKLPKMNELSFSKGNIITEDYNGYDLFKIVGRYLIETKQRDELFNYINDNQKVINDGEKILVESLDYFVKKYSLK